MRPLPDPIVLSVSGVDRSGLLAALARLLEEAGHDLTDLAIDVSQGTARISMTLDLHGNAGQRKRLPAETLPAIEALGLSARLHGLPSSTSPVSPPETSCAPPPEVEFQPGGERRSRFVLTVVSPKSSCGALAELAACAAGHGASFVAVRRLSEGNLRAAEYILDVPAVEDPAGLRGDLLRTAGELGVDAGLVPHDEHHRNRRIVILDMDSTLVQEEIIDMLAAAHGVGKEVADVTRAAMEGETDFESALRRRVKLLAGFPEEQLEKVAARIHPTPGVELALATLKRLGFRLAVLSGGFTFFVERFRERLGLDYAYANTLEVRDGVLTGDLIGEIVDARGKARRLAEIAAREGVPPDRVVAVGDGANDIPMLQAAGMGIAFHAKEATRRAADASILGRDFGTLLYLIGIGDRERHAPEEE